MLNAEEHFNQAKAALLRERAAGMLHDSVNAGDATLWGETLRHAMVAAALGLLDDVRAVHR